MDVRILHRKNVAILSWYVLLCQAHFAAQAILCQNRWLRGRCQRRASIRRRRRTFTEVTRNLTDRKFLRYFRTSRSGFRKLLDLISSDLTRSEAMGRRSSGGIVDPDVRLAIPLRILAGASYLDCSLAFSVEDSTVVKIFHETLQALTRVLKIECKYRDRWIGVARRVLRQVKR